MRRLTPLILLVLLGACASSPPVSHSDSAAQAAQAIENVIRWSTASEVDNFGYDVFRGPTEEGPFERVNDSPIAGHGTTDVPQNYEFRDTSIAPNTAYFYYVESISLQGDRERFTPVFQSRPKGGN